MDVRTWPLSAAATQLLLDLGHKGAVPTAPRILAVLAMKELVVRGHVQITEVELAEGRQTYARISKGSTDDLSLPAPLRALHRALPETIDGELSAAIKTAVRRNAHLFTSTLRSEAIAELQSHGLTERRERRKLFVIRRPWDAVTVRGEPVSEMAREAVEQAMGLEVLAVRDVARAADVAEELGMLALLAPSGLASLGKIARRRGDTLPDRTSRPRPGSESFASGAGTVVGASSILVAVHLAFAGAVGGLEPLVLASSGFEDAVTAVDFSIGEGLSMGGAFLGRYTGGAGWSGNGCAAGGGGGCGGGSSCGGGGGCGGG